MQASQRKLRVEVENLAARNKMIEVTKSASEIEIDESQLAKANALLDNLDSRLSTEEKLSNVKNQSLDRIPVETEATTDILDEVANYFGSQRRLLSPKPSWLENNALRVQGLGFTPRSVNPFPTHRTKVDKLISDCCHEYYLEKTATYGLELHSCSYRTSKTCPVTVATSSGPTKRL